MPDPAQPGLGASEGTGKALLPGEGQRGEARRPFGPDKLRRQTGILILFSWSCSGITAGELPKILETMQNVWNRDVCLKPSLLPENVRDYIILRYIPQFGAVLLL